MKVQKRFWEYAPVIPFVAWVVFMLFRTLVDSFTEPYLLSGDALGGDTLEEGYAKLTREAAGPGVQTLAARGSAFSMLMTIIVFYCSLSVAIGIGCILYAVRRAKALEIGDSPRRLLWIYLLPPALYFFWLRNLPACDAIFTWPGFGGILRNLPSAQGIHMAIAAVKLAAALGFIAAFALLFFAASCLLVRGGTKAVLHNHVQEHLRSVSAAEYILYAGTGLLVLSILRDKAFFKYAGAFLEAGVVPAGTADAPGFGSTVGLGITAVNGLVLSVLAFLIYAPVQSALYFRTHQLMKEAEAGGAAYQAEVRSLKRLAQSPGKLVFRTLSIMAPALAGGGSDLINVLAGK